MKYRYEIIDYKRDNIDFDSFWSGMVTVPFLQESPIEGVPSQVLPRVTAWGRHICLVVPAQFSMRWFCKVMRLSEISVIFKTHNGVIYENSKL